LGGILIVAHQVGSLQRRKCEGTTLRQGSGNNASKEKEKIKKEKET